MQQQYYFGNLVFDADFIFLITPDGHKVKFTKYERALLMHFVQHPGQLQSRERLLSVLSQIGAVDNDRNIDYLLSRLRRKLKDSARAPQFIATQYGEGYMWVAKQLANSPVDETTQIYLSIGPVYGTRDESLANISRHFVNDLEVALRACFGGQRRIEQLNITVDHSATISTEHRNALYSLELTFLSINHSQSCSLVVINRMTGRVLGSFRHELINIQNKFARNSSFKTLANTIKDTLWDSQIFRENEDHIASSDPIAVGIYKASRLFEPGADNLLEVEKKLRQRLKDQPDDARAAIMLAVNIYTQQQSIEITPSPDWATEVKCLILDHLGGIQDDALYLASAAERLFGFGHYELAESMAERALEIGPSFAACYMVLARIKVYQGLIYEGIAFYNLSIEMTEHGSLFYILLISLKSIAYQAVGQHDKVREIMPYVIAMEPDNFRKTVTQLVFLTAHVETFREEAIAIAKNLPVALLPQVLTAMNTLFAADFQLESHRANILQGVIEFYIDLHGKEIIPDAVKESVPSLF